MIPNYDASALLSYRDAPGDNGAQSSSDFVTWSVLDDPNSAAIFELINGGGYPATWN